MIDWFTKVKYIMSNILIIKHGSLGDIVQISGVLKDLRESHKNDKIFILTTLPYVNLLSTCPFVDGVLVDNRKSRLNFLYLFNLSKKIKKYNFTKAYDLQNSSRTSFYKKYLFNIENWSSTETTLKKGTKKKDFDKDPVLDRFKFQLDNSEVKTKFSLTPDFSWAISNVDNIVSKYFSKNFILLFPFCSSNLPQKKWPFYNDLIDILKSKHDNLEIAISPATNEITEAENINATVILNNKKALNIMELAGLIKKSAFVIANDTGPAHIASHLNKQGVVLFGPHTSPQKVSIETKNFKAISSDNLNKLTAEDVYSNIKEKLSLIN